MEKNRKTKLLPEEGCDLEKIADLCRQVNINGRNGGVARTSCAGPIAGKPTFDLPGDEREIGIGIHGEPSRQRMELKTADEITEILALSIIEDPAFSRIIREWDEAKSERVEIEVEEPRQAVQG